MSPDLKIYVYRTHEYQCCISYTVCVLYVKGGGKRPTHDYTDECFDIGHLSRVVVLVHAPMPGVNWLSPVTTKLDGTISGSVFLLLHSEQVIVSLDPTCPTTVVREIPVQYNQKILEVLPGFIECYTLLQRAQQEIISTAEAVMKAVRSRRKRPRPDDIDERMDEEV